MTSNRGETQNKKIISSFKTLEIEKQRETSARSTKTRRCAIASRFSEAVACHRTLILNFKIKCS